MEIKKQLYGSAPVFFVTDLVRSVDFYVNVLGFRRPQLWGDPPAFAMPDWDGLIVMLSRQDDHSEIRPKINIWDMYFWVRDAKSLMEAFTANGATVKEPLTFKEAYGNLEFTIEDPDGYALAFGQGVDEGSLCEEEKSTNYQQLNPVLASQDVARDVKWYEEKLGFRKSFDSGDTPLNYAGLDRERLQLHLQFQFPDDMTSTDIRFAVRDLVPIFREYLEAGVVTEDALRENTAWGTNEFGFFDPSGNRIHIYEDV